MNRFLRFGITSFVLGSLAVAATAGTANSTGKMRAGAPVDAGGSKSVVPEGYRIQLTRPASVGQRVHIKGRAVQERTITALFERNERPVESSRLEVDFNAVARVLAVDRVMQPSSVEYTLVRGSFVRDGRKSELAPRGTVIMAARNTGSTAFTIGDAPVDPQVAEALQLVAGLDHSGGSDDEVLGSSRPRRVGEEWPIDADAAAERLGAQWNASVRTSQVKGRSSVVSERKLHGEPCIIVRTEMTAHDVLPGIPQLAGFDLHRSVINASYEGTLPTDITLPAFEDHVRMNMFAELKSRDDSGARLRVNGLREAWRTASPLRPDPSIASVSLR